METSRNGRRILREKTSTNTERTSKQLETNSIKSRRKERQNGKKKRKRKKKKECLKHCEDSPWKSTVT